jgi:hypothetical protein
MLLSLTGARLGVPHLGVTCTIVTMMLDGISKKYTLQVRKP